MHYMLYFLSHFGKLAMVKCILHETFEENPKSCIFLKTPIRKLQEPWAVFYVIHLLVMCWSMTLWNSSNDILEHFFSLWHSGQTVTILVVFLGDTSKCHCFMHHGIAWVPLCQHISYPTVYPRGRPEHLPWLSNIPLSHKCVLLMASKRLQM